MSFIANFLAGKIVIIIFFDSLHITFILCQITNCLQKSVLICKIEIANLSKTATEKTAVFNKGSSCLNECKRLYEISFLREKEQDAIVRKSESIVSSLEKRREVLEGLVNDATQKLVHCRREVNDEKLRITVLQQNENTVDL
mmetsp:Transcript_9730/g.21671  ORF Transcript_9730/g.21671 Transcript_9730/m.21671 type:complete len:142 (-) Transcript_9730:508-933(-)